MQKLLPRLAAVAATDASVVLRGESGSGKEVIARAIHTNSTRAIKPFVAVNCAALPAELLESELFGHVRGSFTGASADRKGLFEVANGGTLLLDEVAEMPLALQAKLLRALEGGEIRRVGESRSFKVDVRLICATHQNLDEAVQQKRFREDLYYRLKVFTIVVPPLRERREDIPVLAQMFLRTESPHSGEFSPASMQAMLRHGWPGNVRELVNAVKHGVALAHGGLILPEHLPEDLFAPGVEASPRVAGPLETLEAVTRNHIVRVLRACDGRVTEAARVLGVGRTTLWRKLQDYGVDPRTLADSSGQLQQPAVREVV